MKINDTLSQKCDGMNEYQWSVNNSKHISEIYENIQIIQFMPE
jgi:hypothetical protein